MKLERDFSITQARKICAALANTTDETLVALRDSLQAELAEHDGQKGPWRKVISKKLGLYQRAETLECGHIYHASLGTRIGSSWIEPEADKRRCKRCLEQNPDKEHLATLGFTTQ